MSGIAGAPFAGRRAHDRVEHPGGPKVEFLWFDGCPNHECARVLLPEVIADLVPGTRVDDIDASDPVIARLHRFPGSPTIRIDGQDIDSGFADPGDYTPRCRVFWTAEGSAKGCASSARTVVTSAHGPPDLSPEGGRADESHGARPGQLVGRTLDGRLVSGHAVVRDR